VISEVFAAEGGVANDPGSTASGGILMETLRQAQQSEPSLAGVAQPRDLDLDQRIAVYAHDLESRLDGVGGLQALRDLEDDEVAAAVADTLFRHGRTGGTMILQRAINVGRMRRGDGGVVPDGGLGPQTWLALKEMARSDRSALLKEIATMRRNKVDDEWENSRFDHFRYVSPTPPAGN
jgi:lysozyme family protein